MKKLFIVLLISFCILPSLFSVSLLFSEETKTTAVMWVAKINDHVITLEEFTDKWSSIPKNFKEQYGLAGEDGKGKFLDTLIKNEVLYQAAIKKGLDKNAKVIKQIEDLRKQLIAEEFVRELVKGIEEKNQKEFFEKLTDQLLNEATVEKKVNLLKFVIEH